MDCSGDAEKLTDRTTEDDEGRDEKGSEATNQRHHGADQKQKEKRLVGLAAELCV